MKARIMIVLLTLLFLTIPTFGQIALEWGLLPQTEGKDLSVPFDQTKVTANDFKINLGVPVVLSTVDNGTENEPSLVLINNIFYGNKHLEVNNWPFYSLDEQQNYKLNFMGSYDHLVSFGYSAMLMKRVSAKWSLLGMGGFTYAGVSPDEYKTKDIGFNGGFAALRKLKSNWSWGIGLYYSRLTGADAILPLIIIEKETEKSTISITLPSDINYWYHLNKKLSLGLLAQLEGDLYTFSETSNQYDENGQLVSTDNKVGLAYSALTLGPAFKFSLSNGIALIVRTGMSLARRYQYWVPDENQPLRYNASPYYLSLTGHDFSGEEIDFPMKKTAFIKLTLGFGI